MKIHVLPGDALVKDFERAEIEADETVLCRECLIAGAVGGASLEDFWSVRADFINSTYGEPENLYREKVVAEFAKLQHLNAADEVYLWFEFDLFCQANMWFCLSLLEKTEARIYRIAPVVRNENNVWKGFGELSAEDLRKCSEQKIKFDKEDVRLGADLWRAYRNKDYDRLEMLAETKSACFPRLAEVCRAEMEKQTRPQNALKKIIDEGTIDFPALFEIFKDREGVYGFGDAQVKNIFDSIEK